MHTRSAQVHPVLTALAGAALLLGSTSQTGATPVRTLVPLAYDDTRVYLAAEVFYEQTGTPSPVPVADWQALPSGPLRATARYYDLARQDRPADIVPLWLAADDSRSRIEQRLMESPDFYTVFSMLEQVTWLDRMAWGNYDLFRLRLAGGGYSVETALDLFCDDFGCQLSNWIEADAEAGGLIGALKVAAAVADTLPVPAQVVTDSRARMRQLGHEHALLPPLFDTSGLNRPLLLLADLLTVAEPEIDLAEPPSPALPAAVSFVVEALQRARNADPEDLAAVVAADWTAGDTDTVVTMAQGEQLTDDNDVVLGERISSALYSWEAFQERLLGWSSLKLLGYAPLDDLVFVFLQPAQSSEAVAPAQLFVARYDDPADAWQLVSDSDQSLAWEALHQPAFLDFIAERYGEAANAP